MHSTESVQININQATQHLSTGETIGVIVIAIIFFIIFVLFCWSLYSALSRVPEDKQVFPAWFCWLLIIPLVGYVFSWLMLPFGIPRSFENYLSDNPAAVKKAKTLFGIGLAYVIIPLVAWIPIVGIPFSIAALVLWIIYWVKIVKFKNEYLMGPPTHKTEIPTTKQ